MERIFFRTLFLLGCAGICLSYLSYRGFEIISISDFTNGWWPAKAIAKVDPSNFPVLKGEAALKVWEIELNGETYSPTSPTFDRVIDSGRFQIVVEPNPLYGVRKTGWGYAHHAVVRDKRMILGGRYPAN
jgi:hypothetical protein